MLINSLFLLFDGETPAPTAAVASSSDQLVSSGVFMLIFKVIIALYLLYVGVLGRGKLLENKYTKCSQKTFRLVMRLVAIAAALFVAANGALEYFGLATLAQVMWALGLVGLIALLVLNIVLSDRKAAEAAAKEEEAQKRTTPSGAPRDRYSSAFDFDEDDQAPVDVFDESMFDKPAQDEKNKK